MFPWLRERAEDPWLAETRWYHAHWYRVTRRNSQDTTIVSLRLTVHDKVYYFYSSSNMDALGLRNIYEQLFPYCQTFP